MAPLPKEQQSAHVPYKIRPIAATPAELKICERFVLCQVQPFLRNDQNQFAYKKAKITLDAADLLSHTIANSLDGGSKDFSSAF